ncbi:Saccharopine dehydrogenase [Puttea exsequens]|nr:Saccharopine dehydrogenase [Puttea exsequens]
MSPSSTNDSGYALDARAEDGNSVRAGAQNVPIGGSIIESTLPEGKQYKDAWFNTATEIKIARALDDFRVEYNELTSPACSEQSRWDCETICRLGLKAKILTHVRCNMNDARIAVETGVDGLDIVIETSPQLMQY